MKGVVRRLFIRVPAWSLNWQRRENDRTWTSGAQAGGFWRTRRQRRKVL